MDLELWGLMNRLFSLDQGKRLYGLLGAMFSLGGVLTGLLIPAARNIFSVEILLLFASGTLVFCLMIIWIINYTFPKEMSGEQDRGLDNEEKDKKHLKKIKFFEILKSPYIFQIFLICFLTEATYFLVDAVFNVASKTHFVTEERMTDFFGFFYAITSFFEIVVRLFIFKFLIGSIGVISSVIILPLLGSIITVLAIATGVFSAPWMVVLFFWLVISNKFIQEVVRFSVFEPGKMLMYQLLMPTMRIWVHSKTEIVIFPVATLIASIIIFIANQIFNSQEIAVLLITGVFMLWTVMVVIAIRKNYIAMLSEALGKKYLYTDSPLPLDKNTRTLLEKRLQSPHPNEVIYALETLEKMDKKVFVGHLSQALEHPSYFVKRFSIKKMITYQMKNFYPNLAALSQEKTQNNELRADAILAVASLADEDEKTKFLSLFLESSNLELRVAAIIGCVKYGSELLKEHAHQMLQEFSHSSNVLERCEAAKILGEIPSTQDLSLLKALLKDSELIVQQAAIAAVGNSRARQFYRDLVLSVKNKALKEIAINTCINLGDHILQEIERQFLEGDVKFRIKLIALLSLIKFSDEKKSKVINFLLSQLSTELDEIRHAIWDFLDKVEYQVKEESVSEVELLDREITNMNERLTSLVGLSQQTSLDKKLQFLNSLIIGQAVHIENYLYLLFACCYPRVMMKKVMIGMQSNNDEQKGYALELLHNLLKQKHGEVLETILSVHVTDKIFPITQKAISKANRINLLKKIALNEESSLSLACQAAALYTIGHLSLPIPRSFFQQDIFQNQILLKETSDWVLSKL